MPTLKNKGLAVILGLGKTGLSCARFLQQHRPVAVMDTRAYPPGLVALQKEFPHLPVHTQGFREDVLQRAQLIVVSPGISLRDPFIQAAKMRGQEVIGDVELFCRLVSVPIVAITGTNGKSTVTALVAHMARSGGIDVAMGGNFGTPVLDLLCAPEKKLYILELSSFQLESVFSLRAAAATVLNVRADHMDRYASLDEYRQAKMRVYTDCQHAVVNKEDPLSAPAETFDNARHFFHLGMPAPEEYGICCHAGKKWLSYGAQSLLPVSALKIMGRHNHANALAALALADAVKIPQHMAVKGLRSFAGLAHRSQWVGCYSGVHWINDSKATNLDAAIASMQSFSHTCKRLWVIVGGEGKGVDFTPLIVELRRLAFYVIVIGKDGAKIAAHLPQGFYKNFGQNFVGALRYCQQKTQPQDSVLLAPACASYDMFQDFQHRGEFFMRTVKALCES